ncbi:MAG: site-specific DNA-methyltransferase, partial [Bacteroidales bacterium]|nr:site-specific DNA-methyltransferase [Bacteroidales bacterium]
MATNYYDKFIAKLQEIFMMDHAELDFGIYRIMNQKRDEIKHFLEIDLLPQVKSILEGESGDTQSIKKRMAEIEQMFVGMDIATLPDSNPNVAEYKKLKALLEQGGDPESMQSEVFSHLVTFFSRYYDGGDFLSKRRYKDNTYAIPYNGEEVKLHWANADQYYIKTSEYFRNYTFLLPPKKEEEPRRKVHFVLKDASTEQNNNKTANNMERRFALYKPENADEPVAEIVDDELNIYFTYELMPKATKQKDLLVAALETMKPLIPDEFSELVAVGKAPTKDNPNRTLLEKHLTDYTAKNSFDYFIHKDLGGFLNRELDFYLKNEVLHIDDLDPKHINSQLAIVKAIKQVGQKIIQMLAQLENFQRRLWLKKKFVVQCDYCITLDRVPETLYQRICDNEAQRREWVRLFAIDEIKGDVVTEAYSEPLTIEFLKQNQFLVLDTAFFDTKFKHQLIASMENVDEQTNGLLINSENFQALELLQEKYSNRIKNIYADPPYNTSASEIMYKNSYKDSSWLSLMANRLQLGKNLLSIDGIQCTTIDDVEQSKLNLLLEEIFEEQPEVVAIRIKPSGRPIPNGFAISHEYGLFSKKDEKTAIARLARSDEQLARYRERDEKGPFFWEMLRKAGSNSHRENRPTMYYPFYWNKESNSFRIPEMEYIEEKKAYNIKEEPTAQEIVVYPVKDDGSAGCWYFGIENIKDHVEFLKAEVQDNGLTYVYYRRRPNEGVQPLTTWGDAKYSATEHGTDLLKKMDIPFDYPKSIHAVEDCLRVAGCHRDALVLDYFGGSGTTSHAIINLNKEDLGNRKFILCDMAEYFDSALRTRAEKAVYSETWDNGKPVSRKGVSQCFKYIRLEQYEDTLNNLEIKKQQTEALPEEFHESYMLSYMLDTETRDSLLNLQWFENPFAMSLKTTKGNELVPTHIDMVETFNYLIGLNVETEDWYQDDNICVVQGKTHREGLKT